MQYKVVIALTSGRVQRSGCIFRDFYGRIIEDYFGRSSLYQTLREHFVRFLNNELALKTLSLTAWGVRSMWNPASGCSFRCEFGASGEAGSTS